MTRPWLPPGEQKRSRGSVAGMTGMHPRATLVVVPRELGDLLMRESVAMGGGIQMRWWVSGLMSSR